MSRSDIHANWADAPGCTMTRGARTILSLSPDELTLALVRGSAVKRADRVTLDPARWHQAWDGGLHALDQDLRHLLARASRSGVTNATIVYTSPSEVSRLERIDADPAQWSRRVESELVEHGRVPGRARTSRIGDAVGIGVWDAEESIQKLYAWLRRAGVSVSGMIPRDAEVARLGVLAASRTDDETAVLYLDARSSVIAMGEGGEPKLARLTEIGYAPIVEVHARAGPGKSDEQPQDQPGALNAGALQRAFKEGIPIGAAAREDRGRDLLPRLAPVLQRIGVEVKQTFRFAREIPSPPTRLLICGPGAELPGIGPALEQSLDMHVETDRGAGEAGVPFGRGTPEHAIATTRADRPALLPGIAIEALRRRELTRTVAAGGALAAVVMGAVALTNQHAIGTHQSRLDQQHHAIDAIEQTRLHRERTRDRAGAGRAAAGLVVEHAGDAADWAGVLANLPRRDDFGVTVLEIGASRDASGSLMTIVGRADAAPGRGPAGSLEGYLDALRRIDAIVGARVSRTSRVPGGDGAAALRFEIDALVRERESELAPLAAIGEGTP